MNDVAEFLGLRLEHTRQIDVPIYAFETDLTGGDVLRGAERLVKRAQTTTRQSMLVEGAPEQSHLDPLTAAPRRNEFLKTLIDFLGRTRLRDPLRTPTALCPRVVLAHPNSAARKAADQRRERAMARADRPFRIRASDLGRSLLDIATSVVPYLALSVLMYARSTVSVWLILALAIPAGRLPAAHLHRLPRLRPRLVPALEARPTAGSAGSRAARSSASRSRTGATTTPSITARPAISTAAAPATSRR